MPEPRPMAPRTVRNELPLEILENPAPRPNASDPYRQDYVSRDPAQQGPAPTINIEGGSDQDNVDVVGFAIAPPDTEGDVGPNHYMQWINLVVTIYDKSGAVVQGPFAGNAFWQGFGGACETNNDGDPIVRYDQFADRWMVSQFSIDEGIQCTAVSQTGDPTGSYHRYAFTVSPGFNDYPKLNVWSDGYYVTFNEFNPSFTQAVACAFERDQMLTGGTAQSVCFDVPPAGGDTFFSLLPGSIEGMTAPPAGTPAPIVMAFDDEVWGGSPVPGEDYYKIWEFDVDWTDPGSSTFTGPTDVPTGEFDGNLCGFARSCIPQGDSSDGLDSLGQFTMFPAIYRHFDGDDGHPDGQIQSLWVSHTTDVNGSDLAGVRWAEIRDPLGTPSVHQAGTFAPDDGLHRWMASLSVDNGGNMLLSYNTSSSTTNPDVRYTGRLVSDPLGTTPQGEEVLHSGGGSQIGSSNRWGDYSSTSLDESDGCSFWFTHEYYETTGSFDFNTRIGATSFITCTAAEVGTIAGNVTNDNNGDPVEGAMITADDGGGGEFSTTTDAAGDYELIVPAGTYDVTAEAFGYESQTATGITVTDSTTTTQDFSLVPSASVTVDGFVTDGGGAGWPIYAEVHVMPTGGGPEITAYTDPDTGYYAIPDLLASTDYDFTVTPIMPNGYLTENRMVTTGLSDSQENFTLDVEIVGTSCEAPGYEFQVLQSFVEENFNSGTFPPTGWSRNDTTSGCTGEVAQWTDDDPGARGNMTGGDGLFAIADSDECGSGTNMVANMLTPQFDLTGVSSYSVIFKQDLNEIFAHNSVTVDAWDGSQWVTILDQTDVEDRGPSTISISTNVGAGNTDAQVRWHYDAGWDWWWEVDDVQIVETGCAFQGGGLFIGNVTDANTGNGVNGASVSLDTGQSTSTVAMPDDPNVGDGFYSIFGPQSGAAPGVRTLTVEANGYVTANRDAPVTPGSSQRQDFVLDAGQLAAVPMELRSRVSLGGTGQEILSLSNTGTADANYDIVELNFPAPPAEPEGGWPMEQGQSPLNPETSKQDYLTSIQVTSEGVPSITNAPAQPTPSEPSMKAAGDQVTSWPSNIPFGWGNGWNLGNDTAWLSNIGASAGGSGDHLNHEYTAAGALTGNTIPSLHDGAAWGGDLAYNSNTGMLWQVAVGGDNCLYELDPSSYTVTGNTVCGPWGISQRGVAYNPAADSFFVGGWNDNTIYEVASDGTPIRSVAKGSRGFSGFAYNPTTQHLFAQVNEATQLVYVYDAATPNFDQIGTIELLDGGGSPAFADFEGAGLAFDCSGNLVATNQATQTVHVNESGESGVFCEVDIPWFTPDPGAGTVAEGAVENIDGNFDALDLAPSCPEAHVSVANDTPYGDIIVPVGMTVEFNDVPAGSFGDSFIHGLANAQVSLGCGGGNFCPDTNLKRDTMALWLVRAHYGIDFAPPPADGLTFNDVNPEDFAADEIEFLESEGIVAGCSANPPLYCPDDDVTRAQMAVFLLKTLEGSGYTPPPCEGEFGDVSCSSPFAPWIEELSARGITAGCGGGNYCPNQPVPRSQMAVFTTLTFGIQQCLQ